MFSLSLTGIANFTRGLFIFYIFLSLTRQFRKGIGIKAREEKYRWSEKKMGRKDGGASFRIIYFLAHIFPLIFDSLRENGERKKMEDKNRLINILVEGHILSIN